MSVWSLTCQQKRCILLLLSQQNSRKPFATSRTQVTEHREQKCAENYNKYHNKFIFKLQSALWFFQTITVFECCLISLNLLPCILFEKICLYYSIRNGQLKEPALCQLYRHTFVSCISGENVRGVILFRRHRGDGLQYTVSKNCTSFLFAL